MPRLCLEKLIGLLETHYNRLYSLWLETKNSVHEEELSSLCRQIESILTTLTTLKATGKCLIE